MATVLISDPKREGENINAYISYKVTTTLRERLEGLDSTSYTVLRRYSDFVWLRYQLHDAFPYLIVPALPEKQQIGRFSDDFVEVRQRALQRWVDRVAAHPELGKHDSFKKFVSLEAGAFAALRDASRGEMAKELASEGRRTIVKLAKQAYTGVKGVVAQARGGAGAAPADATAGVSRSAEDLSFGEVEAYLLGQAPHVNAMYTQAAQLAVRYREQAQLLLDFGAALRALGQSEGGALGNSLGAVGLASWAASTAAYEQAVVETEAFVEQLADYVRGTKAVKECVEGRAKASAVLAEALADVERLRAHIAALTAAPTAGNVKEKEKAEAEMVTAQKDAADARTAYDKAAAGVIAEVERLRGTLRTDIRSMLLDFVTLQQRTEAKLAAAWARIGPECSDAVTREGGSTAAAGGYPGLTTSLAPRSLDVAGSPVAAAAPPAEANAFSLGEGGVY